MSEETTFKTSIYEETKLPESTLDTTIPELPLVTFDLNFSTLQDFLSKIASSLNKNTSILRLLQEELLKKIAFPDIINLLQKISSILPSDSTSESLLSTNLNDLTLTLASGTQKLCEKIQSLEDFKSFAQSELGELWKSTSKKVSEENFDDKLKNLSEQIDEKLNKKGFLKKYSKIKTELKKQVESCENRFSEQDKNLSEVKTEVLWKVNDIERLLQTRVNEQFVWDALDVLETKLVKQRDVQTSLMLTRQQGLFDKLQAELKTLESDFQKSVQASQESLESSEKLMSQKFAEVEEKSRKSQQNLLNAINSAVSPLEFSISRSQQQLSALESSLNTLTPKVPDNIQATFSLLYKQIQDLKTELQNKLDTEAATALINSLQPPKPPPTPAVFKDMNDFWKFREQTVKHFEKVDDKFDKIAKALDVPILRRTGVKPSEEMLIELQTVGQRLLLLEKAQGEVFKELDRLNSLIKKLFMNIDELANHSGFALISKRSLTQNCLSCGRGENSIIPTIPHVQGQDGRFYKADMTSIRLAGTASDWKEELDSRSKSPIQINRLPRAGLTSLLGKDLTGSLSSNSILLHRPSSAKK